jgi:D-beta-D-heptose 7-phosphate kinase/D-beta-D-heptose 1-phosphate adenosyltransferase|tara:strand:- start:872 stop:1297 length:426 start_codon:yes stop_codon:yes gene_type:complete
MKTAIIVSGYFNPIHKGHLELFNKAKLQGDELWVIVNSDLQRGLKGSKEFMGEDERLLIVSSLKMVNFSMIAIDEDRTVSETLRALYVKSIANDPKYQISFANGGDQNNDSIPEARICQELGISLIEGLGGKIQSSSWLLK